MTELTLADVIDILIKTRIDAPQPISSVVIDSRKAETGSLFVALQGEQTDGHLFVEQAFEQGAIAAIIQQPVSGDATTIQPKQSLDEMSVDGPICLQMENSLTALQHLAATWRRKFTPRIIGITGSVGKSTTKELTWSVLSTKFNTLKNKGNLNNEIGLPLTLLNLTEAHECVVLEMGMYDLGEIELLCQIAQPQIGVVTNVGPSHLERLGTIERIAQAKTELVQALPSQDSTAILNYDDPLVMPMAQATKAKVLTYGLSPEADLYATEVTSAGLDGIRFKLNYQGDGVHVHLPLLGRHSVHTALRAALVGLVEGLAWEEIIKGLQTLPKTAQLRLVAVDGPNDAILLDDTYNASPASTIAALNLLDDLAATKKIGVLGDMRELGSFEEEGHRKVGCRAAATLDLLVVLGEKAKIIAEEAIACGLKSSQVVTFDNKEAVIDYLRTVLEPQNIVLVKGANSQRIDQIVSELAVKKA